MTAKSRGVELPLRKKRGGGQSLQTKNLIRVTTREMSVFTLFCKIHDIHNINCFMEELESILHIILH